MTTTLATRLAFTIDAKPFATAAAWVARHIPSRPSVPVLGGIRLDVQGDQLTVSGFDYEVSATCRLDIAGTGDGSALVSGRLLAELAKTFPDKPVRVEAGDTAVSVVCGSVKLTLPLMPIADYPTLPAAPATIGVVDPEEFAAAVDRVAPAAAVNSTLVELTGVHLAFGPEGIGLIGTDAYRVAVDHLAWAPSGPNVDAVALVAATLLTDVARAFVDEPDVAIGVDDGLIAFTAGRRTVVRRLLVADKHPGLRALNLLPPRADTPIRVAVTALAAAVHRAQLVAADKTPVRLTFTAGSVTVAGAGQSDASIGDDVDCEYEGAELVLGFNPGYLLTALAGMRGDVAEISVTTPRKPVLFTAADDQYRHVVVPIRLVDAKD